MHPIDRILGAFFCLLVRGYQIFLSPFLGRRCRFMPTCSAYAIDAFRIHGGVRGTWIAMRRIVRCHPWGGWGYDPVQKKYD